MANLFKTIKNEIEKGNIYIDKDGKFVSAETVNKTAKKLYIAGLRTDEISVETPFTQYLEKHVEQNYRNANFVLGMLEEDKPAEVTEKVAQ